MSTSYAFDVLLAGAPTPGRPTRHHPSSAIKHDLLDGDTLISGVRQFENEFGSATSLERDMLLVAAAIFAADRASRRGEREGIARTFSIRIPVVNYDRLAPLAPQLEQVLRLLSQDSWRIMFSAATGDVEEGTDFTDQPAQGQTLLFSGGLDSLAAAIEFGRDAQPLQLVSHITHNSATNKTQTELATALNARGYNIVHRKFFVSSRSGGPTSLAHDQENTQRTRSFVFLVIGALVARRTGQRELLYLAENGQMAVHLPLTQGRIGAFSTHTAHPTVLAKMQEFLSSCLAISLTIKNPYVHRTKREVVEIVHRLEPALIPISNSCWMNARLPAGVTHCGTCVPCYIRRIAIESFGVDPTAYGRDVWRETVGDLPANDDARRNIADLIEFVTRFRRDTNEQLLSEFPELYSDNIDASQVIAMYRRSASEAEAVLGRYPGVAPLLA